MLTVLLEYAYLGSQSKTGVIRETFLLRISFHAYAITGLTKICSFPFMGSWIMLNKDVIVAIPGKSHRRGHSEDHSKLKIN